MSVPGKDLPERDGARRVGPEYWIIAGALAVFGYLTGFSIGIPFLAVGLALLALAPVRYRPVRFWPPLAAVVFFFVGYILAVPLRCTTVAEVRALGEVPGPTAAHTVCTSLLGLHFAGGGHYSPTLLPALGVGIAFAATSWVAFRWLMGRAAARRPNGPEPHGSDVIAEAGRRTPRAGWWILAGGLLGLSVIGWLEGVLAFLVALALIANLGARRTPGWPLVLIGAGAGAAWWTFALWLDPACMRAIAFGRPGHPVVQRCLEHAAPQVWPAALSLAAIATGIVLFLVQRRRARAPARTA